MYEQLERSRKKKNKLAANSFSRKKGGDKLGFEFVDNRPNFIAQRKIQKPTKSLSYNDSALTVIQREKKSVEELNHFATISEDWGMFLLQAGDGPFEDYELDTIWRRYGPDDSATTGEETAMDNAVEFNHQFSDGSEGDPVFEVIVTDGFSGEYEGSLKALVDQGIIQAKSYGPQSTNTYIRKGKQYQVTYNRTGKGSIDFDTWNTVTALDGGTWTNPENSTYDQNILTKIKGVDMIDYVGRGKRVYPWKGNEKNRSIHFKAANVKQGVGGSGQPIAGVTWHHQESPRGGMIGVEHEVHKRHGHNGGVALW